MPVLPYVSSFDGHGHWAGSDLLPSQTTITHPKERTMLGGRSVGRIALIAYITFGWAFLSSQSFGIVDEGGDSSLEIDDPVAYELGNDRDCNQVLGVVKAETVRLAGRKVLETFIDGDLLERSLDIILLPAVGDFEVVKICASCQNHHDWFFELGGLKFPGYHATYCSSNTTGYQVPYSSLAFVPLDKSGSIPDRVRLRMFLSMASSRVDPLLAPTKAFPVESLPDYLNGNNNHTSADPYFLYTYLPSMVAASAGSVALIPDPAGTGTSQDQVDRTLFHKFNYDRVAAISYLALKRYISERTSQCTILDTAATVHGANDGAYGALYATQIFQRFGVRVLGSFVQGGVLDLEKWLQQSIFEADKFTGNELAQEWMQLAAYTFSGSIEGVRNTGSGSYLAKDSYRIPLVDKFGPLAQGSGRNSNFAFPANPSIMMTEEIRSILSQQITGPCNEKFDSILCSVILEASAHQVMLGETDRRWIYPLHTCYSSADEIISLNQLESADFDRDADLQEVWKRYSGPVAFDGLSPEIATDHASTLLLCAVEPALFFTLQGHRPDNEEDWPNRQVPLDTNELFWCAGPEATGKPTTSPVSASGADGSLNANGGSPVALPVDTPVQNTNPDSSSSNDSDSSSSDSVSSFTVSFVSVSGLLWASIHLLYY